MQFLGGKHVRLRGTISKGDSGRTRRERRSFAGHVVTMSNSPSARGTGTEQIMLPSVMVRSPAWLHLLCACQIPQSSMAVAGAEAAAPGGGEDADEGCADPPGGAGARHGGPHAARDRLAGGDGARLAVDPGRAARGGAGQREVLRRASVHREPVQPRGVTNNSPVFVGGVTS